MLNKLPPDEPKDRAAKKEKRKGKKKDKQTPALLQVVQFPRRYMIGPGFWAPILLGFSRYFLPRLPRPGHNRARNQTPKERRKIRAERFPPFPFRTCISALPVLELGRVAKTNPNR